MVSITHPFVSGIADDPSEVAAGKVAPSNWNDDHSILLDATAKIVGRKTAGAGAAEECSLSEILDFIGSAARGDLLVRGAATWARLAKGANHQILVGDGTDTLWGDLVAGSGISISGLTISAVASPAGLILPYAGSAAPAGYLLCYGQAILRADYADLFTALSTTWGAGNGTTTFNVPDLRGRTLAGKDDMGGSAAGRLTVGASGLDGATLAAVGGAETHTLLTTQIPSHAHAANSNSFLTATSGGSGNFQGGQSPFQSAALEANTATAGGGLAHNNVQPTAVINYIIKY